MRTGGGTQQLKTQVFQRTWVQFPAHTAAHNHLELQMQRHSPLASLGTAKIQNTDIYKEDIEQNTHVHKNFLKNSTVWGMVVQTFNTALGRQSQVDLCEFKASLINISSSGPNKSTN